MQQSQDSLQLINQNTIKQLFERQNSAMLAEMGGVEAFRDLFSSDFQMGLQDNDNHKQRRAQWGKNKIPPRSYTSWFVFLWQSFNSSLLIKLLEAASVVTFLLALIFPSKDNQQWVDFVDPIAISFSVFLVCAIEATFNSIQQTKFGEIDKFNEKFQVVVIRRGQRQCIKSTKVNVGDLIFLKQGDKIPADALFLTGNEVLVDNSSQTGESVPIKISKEFPFLLSGTIMETGNCFALVCAVGVNTQSGTTFLVLQESVTVETPYQLKLKRVTVMLSNMGLIFAALCIIIFGVKIYLHLKFFGWSSELADEIIEDFMVVLTVFINAVPCTLR